VIHDRKHATEKMLDTPITVSGALQSFKGIEENSEYGKKSLLSNCPSKSPSSSPSSYYTSKCRQSQSPRSSPAPAVKWEDEAQTLCDKVLGYAGAVISSLGF